MSKVFALNDLNSKTDSTESCFLISCLYSIGFIKIFVPVKLIEAKMSQMGIFGDFKKLFYKVLHIDDKLRQNFEQKIPRI